MTGALLALVALGLIAGGAVLLWADQTQRDADGWLSSSSRSFDTSTRALTAEGLDLGDLDASWAPGLGDVRVRARAQGGRPVFVGIGRADRVDAYLRNVAHAEVTDVNHQGYDTTTATRRSRSATPTTRPTWTSPTPSGCRAGWRC